MYLNEARINFINDFFRGIHHGGETIKRKMFFSVLLLISLAVVLNVSFSSATTVNQINITNSTHSIKNSSQFSATSSLTSNKTMISNSVSNLSNIMAAGAPITVNGLTVAQLNDGISRVQAFYFKNGRFPNYVNYGTRQIPIATFKKNVESAGLTITTTVNGLTVSQLTDGISRVQAFYTKNGRLPNYVNYGTRQIPIATFQQNIATAGLKLTLSSGTNHIDTSSISALAKSLAVGSTSQYETAVKIFNWVRDNVAYSFYYNTKYGAAGTLISRTGNCCDKTNLLVALARAAGITAIYKSGYCQFSSGSWYGHVWADLYINGVWYPADSISSRNSLGVIKNWNTTTFTLYGTYTTLPF
jgi:transglutaminase-like putative cysteine protease